MGPSVSPSSATADRLALKLNVPVQQSWLRRKRRLIQAEARRAARSPERVAEDLERSNQSRRDREARIEAARLVPPAEYRPAPQSLAKALAQADAMASEAIRDWKPIQTAAASMVGSVWSCGHRLIADTAQVVVNGENAVRLSGCCHCNSVWLCPRCSAQIAAVRCEEVKSATLVLIATGGVWLMETRTIPHASGDKLADLLDRLTAARDYMRTSRDGRDLIAYMELLGYKGSVRGLEVTAGIPNGWHPHEHALMAFAAPLSPEDIADLQRHRRVLWAEACAHAGLPPPSEEHGLTLEGGKSADEMAAAYIAKYGRRPKKGGWGCEAELALSVRKLGRSTRLNPFGLLRLVAAADAGVAIPGEALDWAKRQWMEFADAMPGQRQLCWGRRLTDWLESKGWRTVTDAEAIALAERQAGDRIATEIPREPFGVLAERRELTMVVGQAQDAADQVKDFGPDVVVAAVAEVVQEHVVRAMHIARHGDRRRVVRRASLGRYRELVPNPGHPADNGRDRPSKRPPEPVPRE